MTTSARASLPHTPGSDRRLILRGAALIDGTGGDVVPDSEVEVDDECIVHAGPSRGTIPRGPAANGGASVADGESGADDAAAVVDLAGKTIMPGFIDAIAQGAEGIKAAIRGGVASIEHGHGTFLVPTLSSALRIPDPRDVPAYLYEKKVTWSALARERVAAALTAGVPGRLSARTRAYVRTDRTCGKSSTRSNSASARWRPSWQEPAMRQSSFASTETSALLRRAAWQTSSSSDPSIALTMSA
ncbi:hypothetical protein SAMN04489752_3073 [Brevibacterium siliguriense]|uniref:Amidohydrolase family protein n=1 Tax=Brevibacterium siliguriense TaxID=1136497 RepID=A0A1H1WRU7_9MICO|nr:hypothetical protein SAMN04489752_3073 [Brevibacterium siliguriense]